MFEAKSAVFSGKIRLKRVKVRSVRMNYTT